VCVCTVFAGMSETPFEAMQFVKIGGNLDANKKIISYFHGIIAGLWVLFCQFYFSNNCE